MVFPDVVKIAKAKSLIHHLNYISFTELKKMSKKYRVIFYKFASGIRINAAREKSPR